MTKGWFTRTYIRQVIPQENLPDDLFESPDPSTPSPFVHGPPPKTHLSASSKPGSGTISPVPPLPVDEDDLESSDDEYTARKTLEHAFRSVSLDPGAPHFFGKSSSFMFLQKALDIRQGYVSEALAPVIPDPVATPASFPTKRLEFWNTHPWLKDMTQTHVFEFPPDDLMHSLVEAYFRIDNTYMPLLHCPTFETSLRDGLHLRDEGFAMIVLLVCAIGSRSSDDPRVLLDGFDDLHSAGWKWFRQAQLAFQVINFETTSLYDLQVICLMAAFLNGSASPQVSWPLIGIGLRLAQARGAHRKKVYDSGPTVETELLKRAFWILVTMDRGLSSGLGRPCAIQDEDFDVELPLECDDEYWTNEDPNLAFKQPPGKPSTISFFNCVIRLNQIHAFALRTIYSINKSKATAGRVGPEWEEQAVSELDSALNNFIDSIPDHRELVPSVQDYMDSPISALFNSGMVLLLNIWAGKRMGSAIDHMKEMVEVHKAMRMLRACERRTFASRRLWDLLFEMASVGQLPLPPPEEQAPSKKRLRDQVEDQPASTSARQVVQEPSFTHGTTALYNNAVFDVPTPNPVQHPSPASSVPSPFPLPVSSEELGRLPVYLQESSGSLPISGGTFLGSLNEPFLAPYQPPQSVEASPSSGHFVPTAFGSSSATQLGSVDTNDLLSMRNGVFGGAQPAQDPMTSGTGGQDLLEIWSTYPTGFE
ncbi:hypothetical protein EIP86_003831 [Pleurotus ostreatoroseus]|nr:hypothetical protein EIP86_003831 [Pleurotus ostreatoroseus]